MDGWVNVCFFVTMCAWGCAFVCVGGWVDAWVFVWQWMFLCVCVWGGACVGGCVCVCERESECVCMYLCKCVTMCVYVCLCFYVFGYLCICMCFSLVLKHLIVTTSLVVIRMIWCRLSPGTWLEQLLCGMRIIFFQQQLDTWLSLMMWYDMYLSYPHNCRSV